MTKHNLVLTLRHGSSPRLESRNTHHLTRGLSVALTALFLLLPHSTSKADEFPQPVLRDIEGWNVEIDPELLAEDFRDQGEEALAALANHLQRIRYIVSPERLDQLQQLPIRIDRNHALKNMQYHPSRRWLRDNGYDPKLAKHVHIPRAKQLLDRSQWAKHPYVVLHELAHAYHDQVLGFDNEEILRTFHQAESAGIYDKVLLHTGKQARHYALSNHKEYFAESTEAFLGVNDFYPFVRAELQQYDPRMYDLMVRVWGPIR